MTPKFAELWNVYPTEPQKELFASLGGGWSALVGKPAYANTCTVRLSAALIALGISIPEDLATKDGGHRDGKGRRMIVKVTTARELLEGMLGASTWSTSKQAGTDYMGAFPAWTGIMLYLVPNGDAGGHVDLWDRQGCRVDCHDEFAKAATSLELWRLA
ncbi:hypothetical protein J2W28_004472 [Variovorax boronicumulans]|uniref:T6SS effector amidase Tae4 family protein n=1 Tax=Variovorax boronicumulans TaxID=436515 RepID=UPI0027862CC2|nr:T6SS effector amidase Tae4 family protein [Variovorax boronicumulans]MDP9993825.1 hypothetical protein [Variovorax boronicumulans]MDQ0005310.1 hypothetical protein [Variovorax boronicumulans]